MLFNDSLFILAFLPVVLIGFYTLGLLQSTLAKAWLTGASLFFYGCWRSEYLILLALSIFVNYGIGSGLNRLNTAHKRQLLLTLGIVVNLGLLAYFKYANFFLETVAGVGLTNFRAQDIILPLAISFYTFTQIAYLVDCYRQKAKEYSFLDYSLFITFFPHLIAGPIVHHWEILPQFSKSKYRFDHEDFKVGLTIFLVGLLKKVLLADSVALYASPVFDAAGAGTRLDFFDAWGGALAYSLQLYFDFSGYSDMAIGLARMFGIKFPLNFNSPYKAVSVIDFWRRWHITLSHFLRDYLYFPLGGNRKGALRRYINLLITMLLGGLWHGAGWTFVFWGALHGLYLVINHAWRAFKKSLGWRLDGWFATKAGQVLTFVCVVVAWVFFRADNWQTATSIIASMSGANGLSLPISLQKYLVYGEPLLRSIGVSFNGSSFLKGGLPYVTIVALCLVCWLMPNTQQWMSKTKPALEEVEDPAKFQWQPNLLYGVTIGVLLFLVLKGTLDAAPSSFLYFNF